jgi:hypothetical protein
MINELGRIWKEAVVAWFKVTIPAFFWRTKEPLSSWSVYGRKFEPETYQIWGSIANHLTIMSTTVLLVEGVIAVRQYNMT